MSSEPPPNPITSSFNLSAWIQAVGSGLSIALANTLYLSKTVASTAAGLITFTAGITTNSITALSSTANASIFSTSTNAVIDIGPIFGIVGESSLIRFGSGGNCSFQFGDSTSIVTAQKLSSFIGTAVSLYTQNNNAIAMGTTSTAITIGTSQANTNTVGIGASGSIISIPGATTCGVVLSNNFNTATPASDVNICLGSTGSVKLAVASNRSGVLNLGDGASSTGGVHLNNGATASGNTRIMNGTNQSGELTLGDAGNTVVIALNRPLTIGYAPSAITTSSQLGYTTTDDISLTGSIPNGAVTPLFTAKLLPAGVWLITYSVRFRSAGTTTITAFYIWGQDSISVQSPPYAMNSQGNTFTANTDGFTNTGTFVVTSNGSTTYNIGVYMNRSGSTISIDFGLPDFGSVVKRTRIA
jgi:hypothetical protein